MENKVPHEPRFKDHKARVLAGLASPEPDASPKGSIDIQILPLINRLNEHHAVFTTSSCSGRTSVFLEGLKRPNNQAVGDKKGFEPKSGNAGIGGKGEGGNWLFVSHEPVDCKDKTPREVGDMLFGQELTDAAPKGNHSLGLGLDDVSYSTRFVHFKFEPMVQPKLPKLVGRPSANLEAKILHIQVCDLQTAHIILGAALAAGFRESGVMNLGLAEHSFPMLAIRCNGLAMDSIIGVMDDENRVVRPLVDNNYLKALMSVASLRFQDNQRRIASFAKGIEQGLFGQGQGPATHKEGRKERQVRKREEGLKRQRDLRAAQPNSHKITPNDPTVPGGTL